MGAIQIVKLFAGTAVAFMAIDLVWLGLIAPEFYRRHLGHLMAEQVRWGPALLFYTIYIAGLLLFAILPGLSAGSLSRAAALGACLGFFAYATFDLTSMAIFRQFPATVVVIDLLWGTVLSAAVSACGYGIGTWLGLSSSGA